MQRDRSSGQQELKGAERELSVHDYLTTILKTFLEDVEKASEDELRLDVFAYALATDEEQKTGSYRRRSVEEVSFSARLLAILQMIKVKPIETLDSRRDDFTAEVFEGVISRFLEDVPMSDERLKKIIPKLLVIENKAPPYQALCFNANVLAMRLQNKLKPKIKNVESQLTFAEFKAQIEQQSDDPVVTIKFNKETVKFKREIFEKLKGLLKDPFTKGELEHAILKLTPYTHVEGDYLPRTGKVEVDEFYAKLRKLFDARDVESVFTDCRNFDSEDWSALIASLRSCAAMKEMLDPLIKKMVDEYLEVRIKEFEKLCVSTSPDENELIACHYKIQCYLKEGNVEGYVLAVTQFGEQIQKMEKSILCLDELRKKYHLSKLDDHKGYLEATGGAFLLDKSSFFTGWGFLESKVSKEVKSEELRSVTMQANDFAYGLKSIEPERKAFDEALEDLNQHGLKLKEPSARAVVAKLILGLKLARDELLINRDVDEFERKAKKLFTTAYPTMQQPRTWSGDRQSKGIARILTHISAVISYYARKLIGSSLKSTHDADRSGWKFYKTETSKKALSLEEKVDKLTSKIKKPGSR